MGKPHARRFSRANGHRQQRGQMWVELLKNEGIPAVLGQLLPGPRLAWGMVPCELRVRSTDVERAREVLGVDTNG